VISFMYVFACCRIFSSVLFFLRHVRRVVGGGGGGSSSIGLRFCGTKCLQHAKNWLFWVDFVGNSKMTQTQGRMHANAVPDTN
jgi:hypothetical protein